MRLLCLLSGGCKWRVINEEWIRPEPGRPYSMMVRHHECPHCKDTKAVLTSPRDTESLFCVPNRNNTDRPYEPAPAKG